MYMANGLLRTIRPEAQSARVSPDFKSTFRQPSRIRTGTPIALSALLLLAGCQGGNSLTRDNFAKTYDVSGSAENGYSLRYNGRGSEEEQTAKWREKAAELCGNGNYDGEPRIFNYSYTGDRIPAAAFGGGVLGVVVAGAVSGAGGRKVAAGPVTCKENHAR